MKIGVNQLVKMAFLVAMSIVLMLLVHFPIFPAAPYLEYEPMDVPILLGTFMYGPLAGLIITFVSSILQGVTVSAGSGWVGGLMHFIATGTLVLTSGTIYKYNKSVKGAIIALVAGCLAMTAVMVPANLIITVKFWGVPYEAVKGMVVPVLIPFNLIKSGINAIVTFLLYKPMKKILYRA